MVRSTIQYLYRIALRLSVAGILISGISVYTSGHTAAAEPVSTSTATNVLFIVLDEAPLFPLLKTDGTINRDRYPGFASLADNSTWYRNMVGTAQRTTEAVPAILDGKWPTFKNYPYLKDHPNNLFTLLRGQKSLDIYQAVTHLCPKSACNNAPPRDERKLLSQVRALQDASSRAASSSVPSLHFAHVLLPHRPWGLTPDLRYMSDVLEYPDPRSEFLVDRRRDNYQSMLRQYVATDALIGDLVTKMKASPNWDNTMIVVTADHGITFEPGKSYRDTIDVKSPGTLEDIYRIPLFIKYPNQSVSAVSDCTASSVDLLPTVMSVTATQPKWRLDGKDLSSSCPSRATRTIRWPLGSFELSTTFVSVVKRVKYYDQWIDANGDVDGIYRTARSGVLLGTQTPASAPLNKNISWRLNLARNYQNIGSSPFSPVPARASGLLFVKRAVCNRCEAVIAINDVFVGVVSEISDMKVAHVGQYFSSSLMSRVMQAGPTKVEMWISDWSKTQPTLTRVGPPVNAISP
mgnify:CR=1 FL=1